MRNSFINSKNNTRNNFGKNPWRKKSNPGKNSELNQWKILVVTFRRISVEISFGIPVRILEKIETRKNIREKNLKDSNRYLWKNYRKKQNKSS